MMTTSSQRVIAVLALLLTSSVSAVSGVSIGDEICVEGYVMDTFCILRGTLLDKPNLASLEYPDRHTVHCLADEDVCSASGYEILTDPGPGETLYKRGWRMNERGTELLLWMVRQFGVCSSCVEGGTLVQGFRVAMNVTVLELATDDSPPLIRLMEARSTNADETYCPMLTPAPSLAPSPIPTKSPSSPSDCLGSVDPDTDYFVHKVTPFDSEFWDISYHNTYKILHNLASNSSYLLYYCGSTPPVDELDGRHDAVVEIPARTIAVRDSRAVSYLGDLGVKERDISYLLWNPNFVYSQCLSDAINNGDIVVADTPEKQEEILSEGGMDTISFIPPSANTLFPHVTVSDSRESTNAAAYEWVKFYSAFFNLEERANRVVDAAERRYDCVAENAEVTVEVLPAKPVVLWAYFSRTCGAWQVERCPGYHCEFAKACSVDFLTNSGGIFTSCGYRTLTTTEFVKFGKDADLWIYPNNEWNAVYGDFGDQLSTMKAVQNEQVFEHLHNYWFEDRLARYYEAVQEFCALSGTTIELREEGRFRNVFNPESSSEECVDEDTSALRYDNTCESLVPVQVIPPKKVLPTVSNKDDAKLFNEEERGNLKRRLKNRVLRGQ
jgi:hypothetical protein